MADEVLLFEQQQTYMYDVWVTTLKTHMGKHYVRKHEGTQDDQVVWQDLITYMRSSTRPDMEIEDLMTYLTSLRIIPTCKSTAQQFILDWLNQLWMFEDRTPQSAHFPAIMKKAMLQHDAISGLQIFCHVKTSEKIEIAKGQGPITYDKYVSLPTSCHGL